MNAVFGRDRELDAIGIGRTGLAELFGEGSSLGAALLLTALHGCVASDRLPETPIEGGSAEQRSLVARELAEFDRDIGAGRLTIPEVRFEPLASLGSIRRHSRVVRLDDGLELEDVRWVLRHELCHALDFEEDLAAAPSDLFDTLAQGLFADATLLGTDDVYDDDRLRRSEALATFCSLGRLPARALETRCGGDQEIVARVAMWLSANVWSGESAVDATWDPTPVATWTASQAPDRVEGDATAVPPGGLHLRLSLDGPDGRADLFESEVVDLQTGELLDVGFGEQVQLAIAREPPAGLPEEMSTLELGWPEGPGAASGISYLWHLGWSEPRIYIFDPDSDAWRVGSPTCEAPVHGFFTDESSVWTVWADGPAVSWMRVTPDGE